MDEATWIYILAAFAIGFLFGMILEAFIDNKAIREQAAEIRRLKGLYYISKNELDRERKTKAQNTPTQINILDRRGIEADELFKTF